MERSQNKEAGPTNVENSRGMGQTDLQLGTVLKFNISFFLIEKHVCSCWLQNSIIKTCITTKLSTSFFLASFSPLQIFLEGGGGLITYSTIM